MIGSGLGAAKSMSVKRIKRKYLLPISNYSQPEQERMMRNYFKFMFVRHPFDRLVSAWRDKFVDKKLHKRME